MRAPLEEASPLSVAQTDRHFYPPLAVYEGDVFKRFMNFVAMQPLVVDEASMTHMKAIDVLFHLLYGGLTCYQRLQSDRPKC